MLRTITLGSCVSVQGIHIKDLSNGQIEIKVDDKIYAGQPVNRKS